MRDDVILEAGDESGLLWAYRLDGRGGGERADEDARAGLGALRDRREPGASHWIHVQCDSPSVAAWLARIGLDSRVADLLTADETRPRAMLLAEGLLVVLRGVNTNPGADPEDMVSLRLWLTGDLLVTARKRRRRLLSIQDIRDSIEAGNGPASPAALVAALVARLGDRIGAVVDRLDEDLTKVETSLCDDATRDSRRALSQLRQQTASIRRYLAPQREALEALFRLRGVLGDEEAYALHHESDRMARYVEDLELARERALVLQEELQNQIAEKQNARVYVLSLVAAVFLPLSFLTGVFGMNVAGLPGTESPTAFSYLSWGMAAIALALVAFMRWWRWL